MKHVKFAIVLIVLAAAGMLGWKYVVAPRLVQEKLLAGSDAGNRPVATAETLHVGGDTYAGYVGLSSSTFTKAMRKGAGTEFVVDDGDYETRLAKLASGELEFVVMPLGCYVKYGAKRDYPGVIIAGIAESVGADGVVAMSEKLKTINDLNNPELKIVYVGGSASEYFWDVLVDNFGLDKLKGSTNWRKPVASPKELLTAAATGAGDVFVAWEPELTKISKTPGAHTIIDSASLRGYLQDVLIVRREVVSTRKTMVAMFLVEYFRGLNQYAADRQRLIDDIATLSGITPAEAAVLTKKVHWIGRGENARELFGVGENSHDSIFDGVINAQKLLVRIGAFDKAPLSDPARIINTELMQGVGAGDDSDKQLVIDFQALSEAEWKSQREVGTLRMDPVSFKSGDNLLDLAGKEQVDAAVDLLAHYPDCRVAIRGHTVDVTAADESEKRQLEEENLKLSLERAQVVMQYMITTHGLNSNRLRAEGLGGSKPLPRRPGESQRAWRFRLPRVEFVLLQGKVL